MTNDDGGDDDEGAGAVDEWRPAAAEASSTRVMMAFQRGRQTAKRHDDDPLQVSSSSVAAELRSDVDKAIDLRNWRPMSNYILLLVSS